MDWLARNDWIVHLMMGCMWIYVALVGLGKGQEFAVFVAFLGMFVWAMQQADLNFYRKLLDESLRISNDLLRMMDK